MAFNPDVLTVNQKYSKRKLAPLLSDPKIEQVREGRYRIGNWLLLFVTLDKLQAKNENVKYNDFFEQDIFYWESQHQQSLKSPMIQKIIRGELIPLLFVREHANVEGDTQEFVYAGKLDYLDHDSASSNPVKFAFSANEVIEPIGNPLRALLDWKPKTSQISDIPTSLVERAKSKRRSRNAGGQGYEPDPFVRRAIELWAMQRATKLYEKNGYRVTDVSNGESYDLLCEKLGKKNRRVEVKGTRGDGGIVILTANEIRSAFDKSTITDLAVCSGIVVEGVESTIRAHSGKLRILQNWRPARGSLEPTQYRYKVPLEVEPVKPT